VIVAYDARSPAAWLGARRSRKLRVPLVLVEEGFPAVGKPVERLLRRIGDALWGPFVKRTAMRLIALDAVAHRQAREAGFAEELLVDLDPGLCLTTYRPALTSNLPQRHGIRGRILLHLGPLERECGLEVLIWAFAATVGRRTDWRLVLAGEGPARADLRSLVDRLGIGSSVHWLPRLRTEEIPGMLGSSTLFAAPARRDDRGSVQLRRALACGVPVLASDVLRHASLIQDKRNGRLIEAGSVEAWIEAIQSAAGSPERRRRWGEEARRTAEERFAWPLVGEAFERVLIDARHALAARLVAKGLTSSLLPE
jgi:glycosyltransferase involved in cell wall biosynthesis